jgi:hypothetical protein
VGIHGVCVCVQLLLSEPLSKSEDVGSQVIIMSKHLLNGF